MASLNDLPTELQSIIQQGYLERMFRQPLEAILGFRAVADREPFAGQIGESITKTRTGLLPPVTTPMAPAALTDHESGLTLQNYSVEQYTLSIAQYAAPLAVNCATTGVAIGSVYLENAKKLGEQATRSVDTLARDALYSRYMGGNTRVRTTLGAPATTLAVDDVRGFAEVLNASGVLVPVSGTNTVSVVVGGTTYTLTGVVADGAKPNSVDPALTLLTFSGSGSNVSTTPRGFSGTLTFSGNVTVAHGTAGNPVVSAVAPVVLRPTKDGVMRDTIAKIDGTELNTGRLTMDLVLQGKACLSSNAVPTTERGSYMLYASPRQMTGLYADPAFQQFFQGKPETSEYRRGVIADLLGVEIVETNQAFVQNLGGRQLNRAIICGQGALVEGVYTPTAYGDAEHMSMIPQGLITVVDGIAHITRPPLDTLQQVITQSWSYIGGFVVPSDSRTDPNTIPTATNAAFKRAVVLETL